MIGREAGLPAFDVVVAAPEGAVVELRGYSLQVISPDWSSPSSVFLFTACTCSALAQGCAFSVIAPPACLAWTCALFGTWVALRFSGSQPALSDFAFAVALQQSTAVMVL